MKPAEQRSSLQLPVVTARSCVFISATGDAQPSHRWRGYSRCRRKRCLRRLQLINRMLLAFIAIAMLDISAVCVCVCVCVPNDPKKSGKSQKEPFSGFRMAHKGPF